MKTSWTPLLGRLNRWAGYLLFPLILAMILTGFSLTGRFALIERGLAGLIHQVILVPVVVVVFVFHSAWSARTGLRRLGLAGRSWDRTILAVAAILASCLLAVDIGVAISRASDGGVAGSDGAMGTFPSKAAEAAAEKTLSGLAGSQEYLGALAGYEIRLAAPVRPPLLLSLGDLLARYEAQAETRSVRGRRTDGEETSLVVTGVRLSVLLADLGLNPPTGAGRRPHLLVYAPDFYAAAFLLADTAARPAAGRSDGQTTGAGGGQATPLDRLVLSWRDERGFTFPRLYEDGGETKNWIKRPVLFELTEDYADTVLPADRLSREALDFVASKRLFTLDIAGPPAIDVASWRVTVTGHVDRPLELSYAALLARPQKNVYATLETISNSPGGSSIGNAFFTGASLADLLREAGLKPSALEVAFKCADGYSTSITVREALGEDVLLAVAMNGRPLDPEHGYPMRVVVPGKYGMKWAKWVTEILVVNYDYKGFWEKQGWSDYAGRDTPRNR